MDERITRIRIGCITSDLMTITTMLVMVFAESNNIRRIERTYSFESPEFDENLNANEYKMAKFTRPPQTNVNG